MRAVRFELTRVSPADLESAALDRSAKHALLNFYVSPHNLDRSPLSVILALLLVFVLLITLSLTALPPDAGTASFNNSINLLRIPTSRTLGQSFPGSKNLHGRSIKDDQLWVSCDWRQDRHQLMVDN